MTRIFYFVLFFILVFPHTLLAQEIELTLSVESFNRKKIVQLSVESSRAQNSCEVRILADSKRAKLERRPESAQELATVSLIDEPQTLLALKLRGLKTGHKGRRLAFLKAVSDCEGQTVESESVKLKLPVRKKGVKNARAWIRQFKRKMLTNSFTLVPAFSELSFDRPVDLQSPGSHSDFLYVVEQAGRILTFDKDSSAEASVFLDIRDLVEYDQGERGLFSIAFHPEVEQNKQFFVHYTEAGTGNTVVARYRFAESGENVADTTEERIFELDQPDDVHNGGQIAFGPDGYLYIALGDGGGVGDPYENGQDPTTMLGAILCIDVDRPGEETAYSVPEDNPFVGNTENIKEEIYAYGLRNPWRFSFDREGVRTLWLADVGQGSREEVNIINPGQNYGWNTMEGSQCYPSYAECDSDGLVLPVIDYSHRVGYSITGGYVYRGSSIKKLNGFYIYADYLTGIVWALKKEDQSVLNTRLLDSDLYIPSFGLDSSGELYVLSFDGKIYRLSEN